MRPVRRRTKIVCTIGPATRAPERIRQLILAGMDVARLNFSHGEPDEHRAALEAVRAESERQGVHVGILQDLQGPKIRTGPIANPPLSLNVGAPFTITTLPFSGTGQSVSTTFGELPRVVHPGDHVLLADGAVDLLVVETTPTEVRGRVARGGSIGSHAGINLPGVPLDLPSLTEKDEKDLAFGLALGVDYVALSFVRRVEDLARAKYLVAATGKTTPVIAKLEKPEALGNLADILSVSDGVMVARGDLGVELPPEQIPFLQKQIIAEANRRAIPVITATQMLESMVRQPRPTRAEASDVANAIFDGTDAVMLSAETAIGEYPVEAVSFMARIAAEADARFDEFGHPEPPAASPPEFARAIAEATSTAVRRLNASAIVARTRSGFTARLVSKYRPPAPIVAVTGDPGVARRLALVWGVSPQVVPDLGALPDLVAQLDAGYLAAAFVAPGDVVVLTASAAGTAQSDHTNVLQLHRVGPSPPVVSPRPPSLGGALLSRCAGEGSDAGSSVASLLTPVSSPRPDSLPHHVDRAERYLG